MAHSITFGATEIMVQPLRAMFATVLLTTFVATAVAQKGVDNAALSPADGYSVPAVSVLASIESAAAESRPESSVTGVSYMNPVLAGNYPDPSVIRVGQDYWATSTSSGWAPQFPILHSRDLVNWTVAGSVFQQRPAWSDGNYWAPEITHHRGRYLVYYVARKIGGGRCVAVASAQQPTGPYQDHGPLVCQKLGSIDPMAVRDEHGQPYLVWKRGGNVHNLPTPILAQKLTRNGLKLVGERTELIRNDAAWEAKVVEAPFIMRHGGWFYMFYSADDCCSLQCNYAMGVARSPYLLGPWEKNPANPILKGDDSWICPGHGSVVSDEGGRDYLMYHAFRKNAAYVGRQALIDEVKWGANQWPMINIGNTPSGHAQSPYGIETRNAEFSFMDDFASTGLAPGWQWPQANQPSARLNPTQKGWLSLIPSKARAQDVIGAVMARATTAGDYVVTTVTDTRGMKPGALAGLAAFGDGYNALGVAAGDGKIIVWRRENGQHKTVAMMPAPNSPLLHLRMSAMGGYRFHFAVSQNGRDWLNIGHKKGIDLPPWDHAVRVALTSGGVKGAVARFDRLRIVSSQPATADGVMLAGN